MGINGTEGNAENQITASMRQVDGHTAQIVAAALQAYPSAARHFGRLAQDSDADGRIRHQIHNALDRGPF